MASYTSGQWSFDTPDCPTCNARRNAQGFSTFVDETKPLCTECSTAKQTLEYMQSAAYQSWIKRIPQNLSISEQGAWITANPPPNR